MLLVAITASVAGLSACNDDDRSSVKEKIDKTRESIENKVGEASARAVAEAFGVALRAQDADGSARRRVDTLEQAAQDLPGDPDVQGIEDRDGDGVDDDGVVRFTVGDQQACVSIAENGDISTDSDTAQCAADASSTSSSASTSNTTTATSTEVSSTSTGTR